MDEQDTSIFVGNVKATGVLSARDGVDTAHFEGFTYYGIPAFATLADRLVWQTEIDDAISTVVTLSDQLVWQARVDDDPRYKVSVSDETIFSVTIGDAV